MGNYNFRKDLSREKLNIVFISNLIKQKFDIESIEPNYDNKWDLLCKMKDGSTLTFECKEDLMCAKSGNLAIEYESRGKFSGIAVCKADYWVTTVHHENKEDVEVYFTPIKNLLELVDKQKFFRNVTGGDRGSNTRMFLFKRDVIKEGSLPELTETINRVKYEKQIRG